MALAPALTILRGLSSVSDSPFPGQKMFVVGGRNVNIGAAGLGVGRLFIFVTDGATKISESVHL